LIPDWFLILSPALPYGLFPSEGLDVLQQKWKVVLTFHVSKSQLTEGEKFMSKQAAKHHKKAAAHHARAAQLHSDASRHYAQGNHKSGAMSAQTARGHALHANDASNEASRVHARHDMEADDNDGEQSDNGYKRFGQEEGQGYGRGRQGQGSESWEDRDDKNMFASGDDSDRDEDDEDEGENAGMSSSRKSMRGGKTRMPQSGGERGRSMRSSSPNGRAQA
jgi:hypothetical protein